MQGDFGDPVAGDTRFDVCVYDPADALVAGLAVDRAGATCGPTAKPCWKDKGGKGWSYKDAGASVSGAAGKGKLLVKAGNNAPKGQNAMPTGAAAALQATGSATLQILASGAPCYGAARGTVQKADGVQFKAKAP